MTTNQLPRFGNDEPTAHIIEAIEEVGAAIVDGLATAQQIEAVVAEVQPFVDEADPEMQHVNDVLQTFFRGVRNVTGLAAKSPTFVETVMLHPHLLGAADAIIGPNCASYTLNVAHLMVREPGAPRQWLHRDQNVWSFLPEGHAEVEVSSVIALTDFTEANGGTVVVPGSHRWEPGREPEEHELAYAEMPAGSAVVYLGSTIHAGGTNRSATGRPGIHLSYVAGWLRAEENNVLATSPAVARTLPRRAQELVGYAMHDAAAIGGGYLGCVDLRDPVDMLATAEL